jgi:hypothetical protein
MAPTQVVAIAFFLALVGLAMTIYLLTVHSSANLHPKVSRSFHDTGSSN